jgi:pyruvate dehydrogenase E2 component (dihydrolipoamide acetyltransferase)
MAEIVRMPKLSDTMTEGVVAKWHKKVGDKIKSGDLLADIETDKATMEFESFQDGVLLHIGIPEKQSVPVDSVIAILGKEGEDISALLNQSTAVTSSTSTSLSTSSTEKQETVDQTTNKSSQVTAIPAGVEVVRMPKLSDTMTDGVIEKWHKKVGDKVKSGELLADIATDKATMEFESFQDGVLIHIGVQEKQSIPVDSIIAILGKGGEDVNAILASISSATSKGSVAAVTDKTNVTSSEVEKSKTPAVSSNSLQTTNNSNEGRVKASPLAKALAKEKGIDISKVNGSGDNGRVTKSDIENYKPQQTSTSGSSKTVSSFVPGAEGFTDEPTSQMRKVIAKRLLESTNGAPHFYLTIEVDMDNAIASRNAINAIPDTKVSFNDLVIKACAAAPLAPPCPPKRFEQL